MLAQDKNCHNLHQSNDKLRDEIKKLEEKLCQWKAEQLTEKEHPKPDPKHYEEMKSVTKALQRANQDCDQLKYVVVYFLSECIYEIQIILIIDI